MGDFIKILNRISSYGLDNNVSDSELLRSAKFINFISIFIAPVYIFFILLMHFSGFRFEQYMMLIYWTATFIVLYLMKGTKLKLNFFYWQTLLINPVLIVFNFYYQVNIIQIASLNLFTSSLLALIVNFGLHFLGIYSNYNSKYVFSVSSNIFILTVLNYLLIEHSQLLLNSTKNYPEPVDLLIKSNLAYFIILSILTIFKVTNNKYLLELLNNKKSLESTAEELSLRQSIIIEQSTKLELANTELNHLIEDINNVNKKLEEVIASKDQFISVLSHDIKNQLSGVQLGIQLILTYYQSLSDDDKLSKISKIHSEIEVTSELLDDLLQWSRILMGKIDFHPAFLPYLTIIEKSMLLVSEKMKSKGLSFQTNFKHTDTIFADEQLIFSIIRNLLTNAIKFSTMKSKIFIETYEIDNELILSITNHGVGISEEKSKKLFHSEQRFSTLGTNSEKGTGLGLMLCKVFTERNSGKIWFESDGTSYTTFFVSFPKAL